MKPFLRLRHLTHMPKITRRFFVRALGLGLVAWGTPVRVRAGEAARIATTTPRREIDRLEKTQSEWRQLLAAPAFAVLFEEDTERPFSSPLNSEKRAGTFVCAACFLPLFDSKTKYDSGTGWPSFWAPVRGRVATRVDRKLFLARTEYHCVRCGGHQGHVFPDGPRPTGKRWCNNGLALRFIPTDEELPSLRT